MPSSNAVFTLVGQQYVGQIGATALVIARVSQTAWQLTATTSGASSVYAAEGDPSVLPFTLSFSGVQVDGGTLNISLSSDMTACAGSSSGSSSESSNSGASESSASIAAGNCVQVFGDADGNGTWLSSDSVFVVYVKGLGVGGTAGYTSAGMTTAATGGNGGSFAAGFVPVTPNTLYSYTVGNAGNGGVPTTFIGDFGLEIVAAYGVSGGTNFTASPNSSSLGQITYDGGLAGNADPAQFGQGGPAGGEPASENGPGANGSDGLGAPTYAGGTPGGPCAGTGGPGGGTAAVKGTDGVCDGAGAGGPSGVLTAGLTDPEPGVAFGGPGKLEICIPANPIDFSGNASHGYVVLSGPATDSWTAPDGVFVVFAKVTAGGGSGAAGSATAAGGGGGAGGYSEGGVSVTPSDAYPAIIGDSDQDSSFVGDTATVAASAGGMGSGSAGGTGGAGDFAGGNGGNGGSTGGGGSGMAGSFQGGGASGQPGLAGGSGFSGGGGSSGTGGDGANPGIVGSTPGQGGGGGGMDGSNPPGGSGAAGRIDLWW